MDDLQEEDITRNVGDSEQRQEEEDEQVEVSNMVATIHENEKTDNQDINECDEDLMDLRTVFHLHRDHTGYGFILPSIGGIIYFCKFKTNGFDIWIYDSQPGCLETGIHFNSQRPANLKYYVF